MIHDSHSIAFPQKARACLVPNILGHSPLENVWLFLNRGVRVTGIVHDPRYWQSSIPKGGLEIILKVTFTIMDEEERFLKRLHNLIAVNFQTPS